MKTKLLLLPLLAVAACGEDEDKTPTTSRVVTSRSTAIVGDSVRNTVGAIAAISEMQTWTSIAAALDNLDLAFAAVPSLTPDHALSGSTQPGAPGEPPMPPPDQVEEPPVVVDDVPPEQPLDPDQLAREIEEFLTSTIFNEANLESQDDASATYLLRGSVVCPPTYVCTWDSCDINDDACWQQPNDCTEQPDTECIDGVDRMQIRIVARPVGDDGVDLTLQIGPQRASPLLLELRSNGIAFELDLGDAKDAASWVASVAGEQIDLPRVMEGRVRLSLVINGLEDVTLTTATLEPIRVDVGGEHGTTSISLAAANPSFQLHAEGLIGRLSMMLDAGALDFSTPYASITPQGTGSGTFSLSVGGASWSVVLDEGQQTLNVTNIGLGDRSLTLKKDETTIFSFDLNAASGRRFDLSIAPDATGQTALFTVEPELDVQQTVFFSALTAEFPDIEAHLLDDDYRLRLAPIVEGGSASVLPVPADDLSGWQGGLEIVSGSLMLSSRSTSIVVNEGECLTGTDTPPTDSHPLLGYFVVTACP